MNNIHDLFKMPNMQIYPTMNCNLGCPYCLHGHYHDGKQFEGFLDLPLFRDIMLKAKPTHFTLLGGGEPLIAKNLISFLQEFGEKGHRFTFITNLSVPQKRIREVFTSCPREYFGYASVTHHFLSGIDVEKIIENCSLLSNLGIPLVVNYVLVPEELDRIKVLSEKVKEKGFSVFFTPFFGEWDGRKEPFPGAYTVEECIKCLDMITTRREALHFFDGVYSKGLKCRSGQDSLCWSYWKNGIEGMVAPCGQSTAMPIDIKETFFVTGDKTLKPCPQEYCHAGNIFTSWAGGAEDCIADTSKLLEGDSSALGIKGAIDFINWISDQGYRLYNEKKFQAVSTASDNLN